MDEGKCTFFFPSYLKIIYVMIQLLFVSDNILSLVYRGTSIMCESPVGSTTFPIIYSSLMSSNRQRPCVHHHGMTTYVRAPSRFLSHIHYINSDLGCNFIYFWLWHLSILTPYHFLSMDYVCVRLVHLFLFFLCLHIVSCPVSFCLHSGFDYFYSCIHVGLDFFLVLPNINHISNTLLG